MLTSSQKTSSIISCSWKQKYFFEDPQVALKNQHVKRESNKWTEKSTGELRKQQVDWGINRWSEKATGELRTTCWFVMATCWFLKPPVDSSVHLLIPRSTCCFLSSPVDSSVHLLIPQFTCCFLSSPVDFSVHVLICQGHLGIPIAWHHKASLMSILTWWNS